MQCRCSSMEKKRFKKLDRLLSVMTLIIRPGWSSSATQDPECPAHTRSAVDLITASDSPIRKQRHPLRSSCETNQSDHQFSSRFFFSSSKSPLFPSHQGSCRCPGQQQGQGRPKFNFFWSVEILGQLGKRKMNEWIEYRPQRGVRESTCEREAKVNWKVKN